ncbi:Smr/MutS family protein [Shimia sediminis]|uniref:Smr/MutS family protein n=1 Tax=Shimia sediminis TaxID=2497945 RepID=UPI000F8E7D65|nr:Smr/MutS family protein [Shimia sediminis]
MTRRKLTPDEIDLWRKVAETAQRFHLEKHLNEVPKPKPKPIKVAKPRIGSFEIGANGKPSSPGHDVLPGISERVAKTPLRMDKKKFGKMKRGKMLPEGKIDLHGMTLAQAHPALTGFILRSHAEGKRLVLVITGKGKSKRDDGPIPVRLGVLKHQVPQWLTMPPLSGAVLQVAEAHLKHGGTGAYYVYLRRH